MGWWFAIWAGSVGHWMEHYVIPFFCIAIPVLVAVLLIVGLACAAWTGEKKPHPIKNFVDEIKTANEHWRK